MRQRIEWKATVALVLAISIALTPTLSAKDRKTKGKQRVTYANGDYYEGELKKRKPHGEGKYVWKNRDWYLGEFKKGVIHGRGSYTWADGSSCTARWKNGKVAEVSVPEFCMAHFPGRYTTGPVKRRNDAEQLIAAGIWIAAGVGIVKGLSSLGEQGAANTPSRPTTSCSYKVLKDVISSNNRRRVQYRCIGKYPNTTGWLQRQESGSWYALHSLGTGAFRGKTKEKALKEACGCT